MCKQAKELCEIVNMCLRSPVRADTVISCLLTEQDVAKEVRDLYRFLAAGKPCRLWKPYHQDPVVRFVRRPLRYRRLQPSLWKRRAVLMQCYVLYITEHIIVVLQTCVRDACSSNLGHFARCTYRSFALIYPLSSLECLLQFHNPYLFVTLILIVDL